MLNLLQRTVQGARKKYAIHGPYKARQNNIKTGAQYMALRYWPSEKLKELLWEIKAKSSIFGRTCTPAICPNQRKLMNVVSCELYLKAGTNKEGNYLKYRSHKITVS